MAHGFSTFLMFDGHAEEALGLYAKVFGGTIERVERYGPRDGDLEGRVKAGVLVLGDQRFRCFDSPVEHDFGFTPAISIFVACDSEEELDSAFDRLSEDGRVLMPPGSYGLGTRFAWLNDRFGVSWQLDLA